MPETITCPRCLWARMTQGADALLRLRVSLIAHLAVCHPDAEVEHAPAFDLRAAPPSRAARLPPPRLRPTPPVAIG